MPIDHRLLAGVLAAVEEDIRCHRENGVDINPYSTPLYRRSWNDGFAGTAGVVDRSSSFLRGKLAAQMLRGQDCEPLFLQLDHAPNPDLRSGYWSAVDPSTRNQIVAVPTLADASLTALAYIVENDLGGGNWTGGTVHDQSGTVVAKVSYNGCVWAPDGSEIPVAHLAATEPTPPTDAP